MRNRRAIIALLLVSLGHALVRSDDVPSQRVAEALARAGGNADQLRQAIQDAPDDEREGVRFLDIEASLHAVAELKKYLAADSADRSPLSEQEFSNVSLTRRHAQEAEQMLWKDHVERIKQSRAEEMTARTLTSGGRVWKSAQRCRGNRSTCRPTESNNSSSARTTAC
ncbi:MAG: hypothetical protein FJ276_30965 [Planctomycetes bacterium]|nr:hypothetical protein [Planctomycetota bacterium]